MFSEMGYIRKKYMVELYILWKSGNYRWIEKLTSDIHPRHHAPSKFFTQAHNDVDEYHTSIFIPR